MTFPRIPGSPASKGTTSSGPLVGDVEHLFQQGLYARVIKQASLQLASAALGSPKLTYLRGVAAWHMGLFGLANKDLTSLGESKPYANQVSASVYATNIQKLRDILPPRNSVVRIDGQVAFRVFATRDTPWTAAIVQQLPLAYKVNRTLLHKAIGPTQVFIFERYEDFKTFYTLRSRGDMPGSWVWAAGDTNQMFFCREAPGANDKARNTRSDYFQSTIVHEFNHALVNALCGQAAVPMWLQEGLATVVQCRASKTTADSMRRRMQRALAVKAFLPFGEITSRGRFADNTEAHVSNSRQHIDCADPYPQAGFMADYFLSLLPSEGLESFLVDLSQQGNFGGVFQKHTHRTLNQFYREWLAQLPHQLDWGFNAPQSSGGNARIESSTLLAS